MPCISFLVFDCIEKVKLNLIHFQMLVNKLNELQLSEVRQLMDILCHIAYTSLDEDTGSNECSALEDELSMLVQKQLGSSQLRSVISTAYYEKITMFRSIYLEVCILYFTSLPPTLKNDFLQGVKMRIDILVGNQNALSLSFSLFPHLSLFLSFF